MFRIFYQFLIVLLIFCSVSSVIMAADPLTDQEKQDILNQWGLPQPPKDPLMNQSDLEAIKAICINRYAKDPITDKALYTANYTKAIQCASCGQIVAYHRIASFTAESCGTVNQQSGGYAQYGPDAGTAQTKASEFCTNTCLTTPGLVPDQAALSERKINVINANEGDYQVSKSALDNQLGITCGLPTEGIDGDATVMSCCKQNYDVDDLQGQMVEQAEYGCPPQWVSTAIDFGASWFKAQSAGLRIAGSLAKGDIGAALKNAGELPPAAFGKALFNKLTGKSKDKEKRFCFSHIGTFVGERVLKTLPIKSTQTASEALKPTGCVEGALPTVNGQYNPDPNAVNCTCMYVDDVTEPVAAQANAGSTGTINTGGGQLLAADSARAPIGDNLCKRYLKKSRDFDACMSCSTTGGIFTGIGCIGTDLPGITKSLFTLGIGLGGGATLLIIFYGAIMIQTSQGNPEKLKKGRQYINSALLGLLVLIFSVLILQLVGADILKIPGIKR